MTSHVIPGRAEPVLVEPAFHEVLGRRLTEVPHGSVVAHLALGCFWGAEKTFWQTDGVTLTAVGYMGGTTPNPTYQEVCTGYTGHAETVRVCYDPSVLSYADLLRLFFENHNPTQGMRQGADIGTQYRSAIFVANDAERQVAEQVIADYQPRLTDAGYGRITTEVSDGGEFFFAENYHQQYLEKNPSGYCPVHATGVCFTE